jgi:hypothetical protein
VFVLGSPYPRDPLVTDRSLCGRIGLPTIALSAEGPYDTLNALKYVKMV